MSLGPQTVLLKSYSNKGDDRLNSSDVKGFTEKHNGRPLPPDHKAVSNTTVAVGKSTPEAKKKSDDYADMFRKIQELGMEMGDNPTDDQKNQMGQAISTAKDAYLLSPFDGIHGAVANVMRTTGFAPWNIISDQPPSEVSGKEQADAFFDFIDKILDYKIHTTDQAILDQGYNYPWYFIESEVVMIDSSTTDYSDIINAVTDVVNNSLDLGLDIAEAVGTDGGSAEAKAGESAVTGDEDPDVESAKKVISSIAQAVDTASQKKKDEETASMCHVGVVKYDKDHQDNPMTWTSYISFLHLVEDEKCGKKTASQQLVIAYITYGFEINFWHNTLTAEYDNMNTGLPGLDITPRAQTLGATTTRPDPKNAVKTPGWMKAVSNRILSEY